MSRAAAGAVGTLGALVLALLIGSPALAESADVAMKLQLEVFINGAPTHRIGAFVLFADHRLGATPNELVDVGLDIGARKAPNEIVRLDDIPGLKYKYDEATQQLRLSAPDALRRGQRFDLGAARNRPAAHSDWGALLNYDLWGAADPWSGAVRRFAPSLATNLDGRLFSPYGVLEQTGIAGAAGSAPNTLVRLNSTLESSDQNELVSYRAGDVINGGLAWTRPVRMGGLQAERDFSLRPDLVTTPLLNVGGTAAVPSSVDVYVNNIKTFSQPVDAGPFDFVGIPAISGAGVAELAVTDPTGHTTRTAVPFYNSAALLAPGLTSWSAEAGYARLDYGSASDSYSRAPIGSATLRGGVFDWLTLEGHTEDGAGLSNAGVGSAARVGSFGIVSAAVAGSAFSGRFGAQAYASFETRLGPIDLSASSQHTFGGYADLASATAAPLCLPATQAAALFTSFDPPKALDNLTFSSALPFDPKSVVALSFIHSRDTAGQDSKIVSASYSRSLPWDASVGATVFADVGGRPNLGLFASLSIPLGGSASVSANASRQGADMGAGFVASKSVGPDPGSYGWSVQDSEGASRYRAASGSYRSQFGFVQAGVSSLGASSDAAVELRGAIVAMGGGVFASNWIDDGLGVVNAGAPGVSVYDENRPVGKTDSNGLLLVPGLHSYQFNHVSIDPESLPPDARISSARENAVPALRGGVYLDFNVRRGTDAALVVLDLPDGSHVPPGSEGRLAGGAPFVVGYDGEAFLEGLKSANTAFIDLATGPCRVDFEFAQKRGMRARLGPFVCRRAPESEAAR